jgi:hypothetical protein
MEISQLLQNYKLSEKKPRKNDERNYYIDRLAEVSGWSKRGLVFSFAKMPDSWLRDAISYCEPFSTQSTRGYKLREFINKMKGE